MSWGGSEKKHWLSSALLFVFNNLLNAHLISAVIRAVGKNRAAS